MLLLNCRCSVLCSVGEHTAAAAAVIRLLNVIVKCWSVGGFRSSSVPLSAIMSSGDGLQQVSKIVNSFFNKPETLAFREPVNPKAMGIPDYPQIVKKPMDLGTVRDRR